MSEKQQQRWLDYTVSAVGKISALFLANRVREYSFYGRAFNFMSILYFLKFSLKEDFKISQFYNNTV